MNESFLPLLALLLGLVSGFVSGIATGGGMISVPGLIFMGLSPNTAIATTSLVSVSSIASAFKYHKADHVRVRQGLPFLLIAFTGSIIGAELLHIINAEYMRRVFGAVCLVMAGLVLVGKHGTERPRTTRKDIIGVVLAFAVSIYTVLVGTGGGFFMFYIFTYFYGMTVTQSNAACKFMALGGIPASILIFWHEGMINFGLGIPLAAGSLVGGYVGAHTALKKEEKFVRKTVAGLAIVSGLKLLV